MSDWSGARMSALLAVVTVVLAAAFTMIQAQTTVTQTAWRTAWGHPDLQQRIPDRADVRLRGDLLRAVS